MLPVARGVRNCRDRDALSQNPRDNRRFAVVEPRESPPNEQESPFYRLLVDVTGQIAQENWKDRGPEKHIVS